MTFIPFLSFGRPKTPARIIVPLSKVDGKVTGKNKSTSTAAKKYVTLGYHFFCPSCDTLQ